MPKRDKGQKVHTRTTTSFPSKNGVDQEYGIITKILGGNWVSVTCSDGHERRCHIRGSLQRFKKSSTRLEVRDTILLSLRDDKTGDVVMKYPSDVARAMRKRGEIVIPSEQDQTEDHDIEFEDPTAPANESFDFESI